MPKVGEIKSRIVRVYRSLAGRSGRTQLNVGDMVMLIAGASIVVAVITYFLATRGSQIADDTNQLGKLQEEQATMNQELADIANARALSTTELLRPHPSVNDRDFQVIGQHANVSWTYGPDDPNVRAQTTNLSYMLEVRKVNGAPGVTCPPPPKDPKEKEFGDYLDCDIGKAKPFMATDDKSHTSRIPPDAHTLAPGFYVWRVRVVPSGTVVGADSSRQDDSSFAAISDWSNYGSFTVFSTVSQRIGVTKRVRVGTNFEQNTQFARHGNDGQPYGFDVSLIRGLIEDCIESKRDADGTTSFIETKDCGQTLTNTPSPAIPQCTPKEDKPSRLCVEFVPIRKWSEWPDKLRRKDIDLFIGGVTAANRREGSGLKFTDGYLKYETRLYVHSSDFSRPLPPTGKLIHAWLTRPRQVGVIRDTSNLSLFEEIDNDYDSDKNRSSWLKPVLFDSFPGLEAAMDRGEIDGMLVDDTFVDNHAEWESRDLRLEEPAAFRRYTDNFLGRGRSEEISMAVAVDEGNAHGDDLFALLQKLLKGLKSEKPEKPGKPTYLTALCEKFWGTSHSSFQCGEVP